MKRTRRHRRQLTGRPSTVGLPRKIVTGARRAETDGETLRCLVLAKADAEWIGADISSGALVRVEQADGQLDPEPFTAVEFRLEQLAVADPGRPEGVLVLDQLTTLGVARRRALRRFLDRLSTPVGRATPLLGMRGPSVHYGDLDAGSSSLVLVRIGKKDFEILAKETTTLAVLGSRDTLEQIPIRDARVCALVASRRSHNLRGDRLNACLGFKPAYALIGLDRVVDGYAQKVVFAILPASGRII